MNKEQAEEDELFVSLSLCMPDQELGAQNVTAKSPGSDSKNDKLILVGTSNKSY